MRELFGRLVVPGEPPTRRRARISELSDRVRAVVEPFVAARLLVADRDDASREPVIEVAHESLLTHWPRLEAWTADDRRWLEQLQHLAAAAHSWDEHDRLDDDVYRGARLEAALEALPEARGALSSVERVPRSRLRSATARCRRAGGRHVGYAAS